MSERRRITIQGIVQGVGFRPFVYGLAQQYGLVGTVFNDAQGVTIEIEGDSRAVEGFLRAVRDQPPPLATIEQLAWEVIPPNGDTTFRIETSRSSAEKQVFISPDVCVCPDCLRELFDPSDRRYGYPFINCTNCGPRFTIIQDVPYDRDKTTMRVFPLCPACQAEYEDPLDRRFHAQPNACPICGPQLRLLERQKVALEGANALAEAAQKLAEGKIFAIKGLGGYHLACDALNSEAVSQLRRRKQREAKPFALMVADLETARRLCRLDEAETDLLQSRQRPIVLLQRQPDCPVAADVAPNHQTLGLMLPYTPLHALLLAAFRTHLDPTTPAVLVMTSGNISDEPIAYHDDEAVARLSSIADGWLTHNRDIHIRCDDSITRVVAGGEQIFRRSRGYVPRPIRLVQPFPQPLLACGGHLKNTFCLGQRHQAFLSHHIGDLENLETLTSFREGIEHFQRLFDIRPEAIVYDLHPEYLATKYALDSDIPLKIGVQHHHAHIASVMAEHGLSEPLIGLAADGTGYGPDGAVWGGEIMVAGLPDFERVGHLAYVPLPGGAQAIRQPWRMAAVYLWQAYGDDFLGLDIPFVTQPKGDSTLAARWQPLAQMIARNLNSPPTSSLGRLFDAVAALLGLREEVVYEGQAAIELEMQAEPTEAVYPFLITTESPACLDLRPLIRAIVAEVQAGTPISQISGRFHNTVAESLVAMCVQLRQQRGLNQVALSGGVFQNRLLLESVLARLGKVGFEVYTNRQVPPNDGGLSLGQAAVAAARLRAGGSL